VSGNRQRIASLVSEERNATAIALGDRAAEFLRLKVEGIRECVFVPSRSGRDPGGRPSRGTRRNIERAPRLVRHGVWLWLGTLLVAGGLTHA